MNHILYQLNDGDLLTQEEYMQLDRDGYAVLEGVISPDHAMAMAARLDELLGSGPSRDIYDDFVNRDSIFDVCFSTPRVLAAVAHVLDAEFKLSSLHSREPLPGKGAQGLHSDWEHPAWEGRFYACNTIWVLDDFTDDNGATRVVPGTHYNHLPEQELEDTIAAHPREVKLLASSRSVVVFNAHLWHGGTARISSRRRRAMFAFFCRRDQPQQDDQRALVQPETYSRLTPELRHLLDLD